MTATVKMADNMVRGHDGFYTVYLRGFQDKTNDEVQEIFNEFGHVVAVKQVKENHFVRYTEKEEAQKAIDFFAYNRDVKVAPASHKKPAERNANSPGSYNQDYNNTPRKNRSWNEEDGMKSPPNDRQIRDHNRNGQNQDSTNRHRNHSQEREKRGRNFHDEHDQKEYRNEHSGDKHRTQLDDRNASFGEKRGGRRTGDFKQNNFSKEECASPRGNNSYDKNRLSNGYSEGDDKFERRGNNDHTKQPNRSDRRSLHDGDGKELAAQEVIIADLPREMLQCDLFTLCREFVNPLEIQLYKIDGDNIFYAYVFVRSRKDVDTLVDNLNGRQLSDKKIVVASVERMLLGAKK